MCLDVADPWSCLVNLVSTSQRWLLNQSMRKSVARQWNPQTNGTALVGEPYGRNHMVVGLKSSWNFQPQLQQQRGDEYNEIGYDVGTSSFYEEHNCSTCFNGWWMSEMNGGDDGKVVINFDICRWWSDWSFRQWFESNYTYGCTECSIWSSCNKNKSCVWGETMIKIRMKWIVLFRLGSSNTYSIYVVCVHTCAHNICIYVFCCIL